MTKARDTRDELRKAILRIEHRRPRRVTKDRCRINISIVAREAGVTPACVHNNYPDIADVIRRKARKDRGSAREVHRTEVKRLVETIRQLRQRLKASENDVVRIASENARLVSENAFLRSQLSSRNVAPLTTAGRSARPV